MSDVIDIDFDAFKEFNKFLSFLSLKAISISSGYTRLYEINDSQIMEFNLKYSIFTEIEYCYRLITEEERKVLSRVLKLEDFVDTNPENV